jgi:hypothetical protein
MTVADEFVVPGALKIERVKFSGYGSFYYLAWQPLMSCICKDSKQLLKFCKWPASTPTGKRLREWIAEVVPEAAEVEPTADTKTII